MNTGEGGLSPYHLKGGADIICQIGPGLFGVRTEDGAFSFEEFKKKANTRKSKPLNSSWHKEQKHAAVILTAKR